MEAILVESMMWTVGGAVLGILAFQTWNAWGRKKGNLSHGAHSVVRAVTNNPRRVSNGTSLRKSPVGAKHANTSLMTTRCVPATSKGVQIPSEPGKAARPVAKPEFQTCPSCRLVAQSASMEEHFSGSPFHRDGRNRGAVDDDEEFRTKPVREQDPAIPGLLRSLLRLLVPPRAFGLRGQERNVDPLRGFVQRPTLFASIPSTFGLVP